MTNKNRIRWIVGVIAAFLMGLLVTLAYQAIIWAPVLTEIASVTWNDSPVS